MIKKETTVIHYISEDGRAFQDKEQCARHELRLRRVHSGENMPFAKIEFPSIPFMADYETVCLYTLRDEEDWENMKAFVCTDPYRIGTYEDEMVKPDTYPCLYAVHGDANIFPAGYPVTAEFLSKLYGFTETLKNAYNALAYTN